MTEQHATYAKYSTEINQAQNLALGDHPHLHVEQHIHAAPPPAAPMSRDELLAAIRQASAELRACPSDIADIHIKRVEVAQIVEWVLNADPRERLGMLLDQPGGGKTVVMRDVLERLEANNVPVLAIKADNLSGLKTRADLAERLGLPVPTEVCVQSLATEGPLVVLLDQLDALSLALARDQANLDVMLSILARLRDVDGVRVVASCRTFDLNNDPRLSTIKVDRKFHLHPLDEAQVNEIMQAIGIDPARLLPAHRTLLRVPLHLSIYAKVVASDTPKHSPESFRTLQELYDALWQKRIEVVSPHAPARAERIAAIYRLVEAMQDSRQLSAPVGLLDEHTEAANYLEREGFIRRERGNWLFFHQTLFDYCYARRFVAQRHSLSQDIMNGPQGLFERSQMVQVLAYLRGVDEAAYRQELTNLLFADGLRVHLRLLLIGWLGSLPNPTANELRIARRLLKDTDDRACFLQAAGGNEDWFDLLNGDVLPSLLRTDDEGLISIVTNYLGTLIQHRTEAILAHLRPHLGKSEAWDARIAFSMSRLENWQGNNALDMFCDLLQRGRAAGWEGLCLHQLASSNPAAGCKALRAYLDHRWDDLLASQDQVENQPRTAGPKAASQTGILDRLAWNEKLFGEYAIGEVMERAVAKCPAEIIEHLLPWFVRAATFLADDEADDSYPSDSLFAWGWHSEHISASVDFAQRLSEALARFAKTRPAKFRRISTELANVESLAVQRILAWVYLSNPEEYAEDIFEFLTADPRRLNIGERLESPDYDSCRLFGAAFQCLGPDRCATLEQLILDMRPRWEKRSLQHRGLTQLRFFKSVPQELLSDGAYRRLQELERKFPDFEPLCPSDLQFSKVTPPIEQPAQAKMSDEAWLGAMRKYDDSTAWDALREDFFRGGVIELSRAFAEQVKNAPERFYRLAQRFDDTISLKYVGAAISGLAESEAPAEWVFDLVRRFAPRVEGESRKTVCWALRKRVEAGVPDALLDVISDWALRDPDPTEELRRVSAPGEEPYSRGDPHSHGIHTNRGVAVEALCRCALGRTPPQVERAFHLLEQAAGDPSTAVRACVIESLGPMLKEDDTRALAIFERAMDGHPRMLQIPLVYRFLYWTYYHHFPRTRSFIETLLAHADEVTRQAGARLACLAAFRYPEADELAEQAMRGDAALRRGAVQVYARNLERSDVGAVCQERLLRLMNDPDEQVRAHVGECFEYLHPEQLDRLRPFIEEFLDSPSLLPGAWHLIKYLAPLAADEPDLTLRATDRLLDEAGEEIVDIRTRMSILERDLARLPLTVYTHAFDPTMKSRAMDAFERLLLLGSRTARETMIEWDRR